MTNDILVETGNVAKDYNLADGTSVNVLIGITCTIRAGDRLALVGPSGSGKSTLMHILGGLVEPTRGAVNWPALGIREQLQPSKVQFVFQSPSLFPALNIARNVALPMVLAGGFTDSGSRAQQMLERFGLADLAEKLPEELSGGQAQRVAMARALVIGPKLVLADEPTGQLDSSTANLFLETVFEVAQAGGTALLVATHDSDIAGRMDQRWMLDRGVLKTSQHKLESVS
ncbi:ABC transporter ATP-binding protein [Hoeflea sp. AS60]|uniref:ABC transporter ATP-binding protein n=1 Tax=Hoeflea sp. AS60 TaxID=3135780 RepID=UPI003177A008